MSITRAELQRRTAEARTDDVAMVLDEVRRSGKSAMDIGPHGWSTPVFVVAMAQGIDVVRLQDRVTAYAAALDAWTDAASGE